MLDLPVVCCLYTNAPCCAGATTLLMLVLGMLSLMASRSDVRTLPPSILVAGAQMTHSHECRSHIDHGSCDQGARWSRSLGTHVCTRSWI